MVANKSAEEHEHDVAGSAVVHQLFGFFYFILIFCLFFVVFEVSGFVGVGMGCESLTFFPLFFCYLVGGGGILNCDDE